MLMIMGGISEFERGLIRKHRDPAMRLLSPLAGGRCLAARRSRRSAA
jgi:hypothetical protein